MPVIPTGVLRDEPEMREIGHGTEPLRGCFQVPEPVTDPLNHVIQRWKRQIGQRFFADLFPHVFHGTLVLGCRLVAGSAGYAQAARVLWPHASPRDPPASR